MGLSVDMIAFPNSHFHSFELCHISGQRHAIHREYLGLQNLPVLFLLNLNHCHTNTALLTYNGTLPVGLGVLPPAKEPNIQKFAARIKRRTLAFAVCIRRMVGAFRKISFPHLASFFLPKLSMARHGIMGRCGGCVVLLQKSRR